MKKYLFVLVLAAVIFFLGKNLNPFDLRMFDFHDDTQAARIQQMAVNIKHGQIPPRLAPDMSGGLGFSVFNFYAPTAYWITTGLHLIGIPIPIAIKTSFLAAIIACFIAMYLFLRQFFSLSAGLFGSVIYTSSLWMAIEIFIRGNISEVWFLAFFPLGLYILYVDAKAKSKKTFILSIFVLCALFTVHNVLSLISLFIFVLYLLYLPNKKRSVFILITALILSSYFLLPAIFESGLTYASIVAKKTHFHNHFLCIGQLWSAPNWQFGGSGPGCNSDTMPFTLGKIHIVTGLLGISLFLLHIRNQKKNKKLFMFFLSIGMISVFLTTYQSSFIWYAFSPVFSLFQFPWRFLVFGTFLLGFFSAYLLHAINIPFKQYLGFILILLILFTTSKYYSKPWLYTVAEYTNNLISPKYISQKAAYHMAEYLPKTADYDYWRSLDLDIRPEPDLSVQSRSLSPIDMKEKSSYKVLKNNPFSKEISISKPTAFTVNIHYFPFWEIYINNNKYIPKNFDRLGRPIVSLTQPSIVHIFYTETLLEKISDVMSLCVMFFIGMIVFYKPVWNKLNHILK
ncbi:MAG: hypothetical protein WC489_01885 [Patescibacteria group bacterium]